jgi:predicted enzyme related to lactoylglutathione lyase
VAKEKQMARVLGVGGVFMKANDGPALRSWYKRVLDIDMEAWGVFLTPDAMAAHPGAGTIVSFFKTDTDYFAPSSKDFMFNFAVDDLDGMLARVRAEGVEPVKLFDDEPNGRFAHLVDPEGTKIELWQPKPMS